MLKSAITVSECLPVGYTKVKFTEETKYYVKLDISIEKFVYVDNTPPPTKKKQKKTEF